MDEKKLQTLIDSGAIAHINPVDYLNLSVNHHDLLNPPKTMLGLPLKVSAAVPSGKVYFLTPETLPKRKPFRFHYTPKDIEDMEL